MRTTLGHLIFFGEFGEREEKPSTIDDTGRTSRKFRITGINNKI